MSHKTFISCTVPNINDLEQHRRMQNMEHCLRKFRFQQVEGMFEGNKEISFLVHKAPIEFMLDLAHKFEQDSILVVSSYGGAMLHYTLSEETVLLGELKTKTAKPWSGDYSYDPFKNCYYVVQPIQSSQPVQEKSNMSCKDYRLIADVVSEQQYHIDFIRYVTMVESFTAKLSAANPNFNAAKFEAVCYAGNIHW